MADDNSLQVRGPRPESSSPKRDGVKQGDTEVIFIADELSRRKNSDVSNISAFRSVKSSGDPVLSTGSFSPNLKSIKLDFIVLCVVLLLVWGLLTLPIIYFHAEIVSFADGVRALAGYQNCLKSYI